MGAARRVTDDERRARLSLRHHLAAQARAGDVVEVARGLVALHSTDAASVYLAAWARLEPGAAGDTMGLVQTALYEDRTLVRMLGMRRTVFVVPVELVPVVHASSTRAIAALERRKLHQLLIDGGITDEPGRWLAEVEPATVAALRARGEALASELSADVPELREQVVLAAGKAYEGRQGVGSRVLFLLAADGRVVRGRPRGSWISSQYRWAPIEAWLPGGMPALPVEAGRVELVRRWLARYGPGTLADLKWWTGWTVGQLKPALAALGPVEVDLDGGGTGLVLPDDLEPVPAPEPSAALLPGLDPTVMGWVGRDWYLGGHGPELFDRTGNAGPTIWWDGRVVGGWTQRDDGEIAYHLLADIGAEAAAAVAAEAGRLGRWLGPARVTPRFRTPLERKLAG
jgi:Winged helix DNA-binding domain